MKIFSVNNKEIAEGSLRSISIMLITYGLAGTVDYFCKISVFSLD